MEDTHTPRWTRAQQTCVCPGSRFLRPPQEEGAEGAQLFARRRLGEHVSLLNCASFVSLNKKEAECARRPRLAQAWKNHFRPGSCLLSITSAATTTPGMAPCSTPRPWTGAARAAIPFCASAPRGQDNTQHPSCCVWHGDSATGRVPGASTAPRQGP